MKAGDLVTVETFGIGVIIEVDKVDVGQVMFKVAFFNEFHDEWLHCVDLDKLEVIDESR
mgnify:CR=1 FL=1